MKDDDMQNGQLKPAYNVQIAVENYFIIHTHISNDRTDHNTLIPVLEKHKETFGKRLEEVTSVILRKTTSSGDSIIAVSKKYTKNL